LLQLTFRNRCQTLVPERNAAPDQSHEFLLEDEERAEVSGQEMGR
jgi:hypothetical protein